jgi:hypothetical protein
LEDEILEKEDKKKQGVKKMKTLRENIAEVTISMVCL